MYNYPRKREREREKKHVSCRCVLQQSHSLAKHLSNMSINVVSRVLIINSQADQEAISPARFIFFWYGPGAKKWRAQVRRDGEDQDDQLTHRHRHTHAEYGQSVAHSDTCTKLSSRRVRSPVTLQVACPMQNYHNHVQVHTRRAHLLQAPAQNDLQADLV